MSDLSEETLQSEFQHALGVTYLDHAGATLYSSRQLEDHVKDLSSNLYSNPHSGSPSSAHTTALVDSTREMVLKHFHTTSDQYSVVFTAGCTAALSLLSHAFPWEGVGEGHTHPSHSQCDCGSVFCYLDDNHTSVVGMREVARSKGARTLCVSTQDIQSQPLPPQDIQPRPLSATEPLPPHLFAFPAQSNFSGGKYPLSWCSDIPSGRVSVLSRGRGEGEGQGRWYVVLDAASYVSTSPLDLSVTTPHFLTLSFYKLFGFPTGLGALLVRRDAAHMLIKPYYGGGTVKATDSWTTFHVPKDKLHDRLEDGTLPFLEVLALRHGFAALKRLGASMERIQNHTFSLARTVYRSLSNLRHGNGGKVCVLYSKTDYEDSATQGPIVNFNLLRADGRVLGYHQVDKLASVCNIHLRTGCFCNTGACMSFLGLDSEKLKDHLEQGHECGDSVDLIDGRPTGSVRVSFGYMSSQNDVSNFLDFIKRCFVDCGSAEMKPFKANISHKQPSLVFARQEAERDGTFSRADGNGPLLTHSSSLVGCGDQVEVSPDLTLAEACVSSDPSLALLSVSLFPVKSCAGFSVRRWPLGEKGLLYDREWMVVSENGILLSQKQEPKLHLIQPSIDIQSQTLTLVAKGCPLLRLPASCAVSPSTGSPDGDLPPFSTRVCGDKVLGVDCGEEAAKWLTSVLGRRCRLLRQNTNQRRSCKRGSLGEEGAAPPPLLSLANEAQYLLVARGSLEHLLEEVRRKQPHWVSVDSSKMATRFRANFVVGREEMEPYAEESWKEIRIAGHLFQVVGRCVRCQMVCLDPETGERSPEPLKTLFALKGSNAPFGIYLRHTTV